MNARVLLIVVSDSSQCAFAATLPTPFVVKQAQRTAKTKRRQLKFVSFFCLLLLSHACAKKEKNSIEIID
jgi:hypothetical protein